MRHQILLSMCMLVFAALLIGCGSQWAVVTQASPNPFAGQRHFAVLPIDYTGLRVGEKFEAEYLSEKDADQQQSFIQDKVALNEEFAKALINASRDEGINVVPATGPAAAPFMIRPHVDFVEPGTYVVVASAPSEVRMTLQITMPDGRVLDEILLKHSTDSRSGFSIGGVSLNPSSGGRLRKDGEGLGELVAEYLKSRAIGD